jgi:hypothetical protein
MPTCRRLRYFLVVAFFLCAVSCGFTTGRCRGLRLLLVDEGGGRLPGFLRRWL